MVDHHGSEGIEPYLLTVMNIVSIFLSGVKSEHGIIGMSYPMYSIV